MRVVRNAAVLVGGLALVACDTPTEQTAAPAPEFNVDRGNDGPSVNAGGGRMWPIFLYPDANGRFTASFHARGVGTDAKGSMQGIHRGWEPAVSVKGPIDCLVVDPVENTAVIMGVWEKVENHPFLGNLTGRRFWVQLWDNGDNNSSPLDRFLLHFHQGLTLADCQIGRFQPHPVFGPSPWHFGDIQIKR